MQAIIQNGKVKIENYLKTMNVGEITKIPTGNAQLVYGIKGEIGELFSVTRDETMVPKGKYEVISSPEKNKGMSGPWGTFSDITIKKIE